MNVLNLERRSRYGGQGYNIVKTEKRLDLTLDIQTLDIMCRALVTNNQGIRRGQLVNLRNLIALLNQDNYINDPEKEKRISFIKKGIEARLICNLTDPYMILSHINGGILDSDIVNLDEFNPLNSAEIQWLNSMVSESLKFSHAYNNADMLIDICTRLKSANY